MLVSFKKKALSVIRPFLLLLKAVVFVVVLILTLLVGNAFQLLSLLIYPFSVRIFYKFNAFIAYCWWGLCAFFMFLADIQVKIQGDPLPIHENAIVISNHQAASDIPVLFKLALRSHQLGNMKWFVKEELKYVPGVGWGMLLAGCLFLKRRWVKDKAYIQKKLSQFQHYNVPVWLMIFPEGSRFTPKRRHLNEKIARKRKVEPLRHVMFPRLKGFSTSVQQVSGYCDAVYDVTILYGKSVPSLVDLFVGKVKQVTVQVRRFAITEIDNDETRLSEWLDKRFYEKDAMIHEMKSID